MRSHDSSCVAADRMGHAIVHSGKPKHASLPPAAYFSPPALYSAKTKNVEDGWQRSFLFRAGGCVDD